MTPSLLRAAIVALCGVLLLTACRKKSAPAEPVVETAPPAVVIQNPQAPRTDPGPRERLLGTWERAPIADGWPVRMEFRPDGTATLEHFHPDGNTRTNQGTFTAPEGATGTGPHQIQVKVPNGAYGFRIDFRGAELIIEQLDGPGIAFRRAK
jgi:hypothetical protein